MFAIVAATAVLIQTMETDPASLNGRGWAIRCAVSSQLSREDSELQASIARTNDAEEVALRHDAAMARAAIVYEQALIAPQDVPAGPERFALAHQFREWAKGLSELELIDVLGACEVALAPVPPS